jgi:tRNA wybutosine-synthesizing protein 5
MRTTISPQSDDIATAWKGIELEPLEIVPSLTRQEYLCSRRFHDPVVIKGGAADTAAVRKWDLDYLRRAAGGAAVEVGHLAQERPHDYTRRDARQTTLGAFLDELEQGSVPPHTYLFNDPSCLFLDNPGRRGRTPGWGAAAPNPGLAPLAADFTVPAFIGADYLFATLILGPPGSGTSLHYDWGGEAKAFVQIRGSKHVTLFPPAMAPWLDLSTLLDGRALGSNARLDRPDSGSAACPGLLGFYANLEPGDVLYFPAFWFHKVENTGRYNLAVGVGIDELPGSPLALRLGWYAAARIMMAQLGRRIGRGHGRIDLDQAGSIELHYRGQRITSLGELFGAWEAALLSPSIGGDSSLWSVVHDLLAVAAADGQQDPHRPDESRTRR